MKENLEKLLFDFGVNGIEEKLEKLERYKSGILKWNKKVNITKITNDDDFYRLHYIDSLLCTQSEEFKNSEQIIDVGTGGGFPGIPMAIVFPEKNFLLLDSSRKRLNIIETLAEELGIKNIEVMHGRAEEIAAMAEYREKFDLCVSRAVARLQILVEYCLGFVKVGGTMIAFKGPGAEEEISDASKAIAVMGGFLNGVKNFREEAGKFGFEENHRWIYIMKSQNTPEKYPRSGGKSKSRPIR